jgi:nucleoporin POM152
LGELQNSEHERDQVTFNSIQSVTRLQMRTGAAGMHSYRIRNVGDAAYPLNEHPSAYLEGLLLEQDVLPRPSAHFRSSSRVSYCLNDAFVHRQSSSDDATIVLRGTPPFLIQLSIRNLASSDVKVEKIEINKFEWKVDLPKYHFKTIGPHLVTLESVEDASGCPQVETDLAKQSFWVDVAETAAIVPFDRREEFCVGDILHFQLEGTPPWRVQYVLRETTSM